MLMFVRRFYDDRLAQATYLIGCQRTGEAIVIDPPRDTLPILEAARAEGLRLTKVTETHIHADFVSGARELAADTGATVYLSGEGGPDWQYAWAGDARATLLHDHDTIILGGVRIDVWHTPGHTPEHLAFVVIDSARSDDPVALVSGDFVFVGDVGRPDLLEKAAKVAGTMEASARQLYHSLQRLSTLPDHLQIWPGHGAGSACGKSLGAMPSSTLGYERRTNWAFGMDSEAAFVAAVLEGQPEPPTYFAMMKRLNRNGPPLLGERGEPIHLPPDRLDTALASGPVLDVRSASEHASGHVRGTVNIPLIKAFTTWAGWLLGYERPIALVAPDVAAAAEARRALASIGLDQVTGWFGPDLLAAHADGARWSTAQRGEVTEADAMLAAGRTVIDLRESSEWEAGHIPGVEHHPLGRVQEELADRARDTPLAVHCQSGTRSAIGASVLEAMGFTDVIDLSGGYSGWVASGGEGVGG
jgi:hydroxyacylglutathione hydrolase